MTMTMINTAAADTLEAMTALRREAIAIELQTGSRAVVVLACAGYSDEHWQLWIADRWLGGAPAGHDTPDATVLRDGTVWYRQQP